MTLQSFALQLYMEPTVECPVDESWIELIARISVAGVNQQIPRDEYYYFLNVLPPKYMVGDLFAFAGGAEPLRLFWDDGGFYVCRQLTWAETETFCRLAGIRKPS